ncbi:50S ribosomal protein L31 [Candidatus Curtissbacteria bacterium]|nr:50S ribosomal protein L31 [Candidatus Curtissbacteria bacterium]
MKTGIHPKFYEDAKVSCVCGNAFTTGSTMPEIHVEVCSKCHPFFTGEMKYVDTLGRVEKFQKKQEKAKVIKETQIRKKLEGRARPERPDSLRDLFALAKKQASS